MSGRGPWKAVRGGAASAVGGAAAESAVGGAAAVPVVGIHIPEWNAEWCVEELAHVQTSASWPALVAINSLAGAVSMPEKRGAPAEQQAHTQAINQSIKQASRQANKQSIDQSNEQTTNQPINQSINQSNKR